MAWPKRRNGAARALWVCVLGAGVGSAHADEPKAAPEAAKVTARVERSLGAAIDPLDRARTVAQLGDARVLALLAVTRGEHGAIADAQRVLGALRSVRWLADPTPAVPALLELSQGRDPDLAPAAAEALVEIARHLAEGERMPESVRAEQLGGWTELLAPLQQNTRLRPDIRLAATQAIALLNAARERL